MPLGRATLRVSVGNLFDRRYLDPVGEEIRASTVAQDGRTALATFTYPF